MSTTILKESYTTEGSESMVSPTINVPNVTSISPLPEIRRDSSCSTDIHLVSLPVPKEFADSRHGSFADPNNEKSVFSLGCCVENAMFIYESKDVRSEKLSKMYSDSEEEDEKRLRRRNDNAKEDSDGEKQNEEDDEESEYGENLESKLEDEAFFGKHVDSLDGEFNLSEKKFVGSLSEEFANIGHIDSSETSDDSPEAFTKSKEGDDHANTKIRSIARSSLRESIKESEFNFQSSIDGVCNFGSELDMTNLFSTSPEEEEECSEEYKREMGLELAKRCSIAHFIEGSDIARKSIKCRHRKKSFDDLDLECVAVAPEIGNQCPLTDGAVDVPRIRVLNEDNSSICILPVKNQMNIQIRISGDNISNINDLLSDNDLKPDRRSCTLSLTDDEECVRFEGLKKDEPITNSTSTGPTVIIDPPSPTHRREDDDDAPSVDIDTKPSHEAIRRLSGNCRRLSAASPLVSGHCSPIPTRRISNISPVPPFDSLDQKDKHSNAGDKSTQQKALPIINPLVRLPQWPNVVTEHGIIGKVLLANADALCAAAVPLMDPDETLMEGFFERCVMNNYFGIGIDAKISLDFHHKREEHPEKCRSRTRNYMWYGVLGSKQWLQKTCKNLEQRVQLECDGQRIPLPSLQGIVVLNIPSFMGGINFWGGTKEDDVFLAPSIDDHILEVVAVFGTVQMAASRLINLQHHRIAQCNTVQISILGEEGVPIQVDGEAWIQPPGMIRIIHKNRMKMLCRNKGLESSLKAWEEKQRQIRHQNRLHSTSGKLTALTEDEMNILLGFIESLTSLIKYVKMLIIRDPSIEADLYQLAAAVGINLERVHPKGKILQGLELRPVVTELVVNAQRLVEETNAVLRDKNIQTASEMERQLNSSIQNMVMELKKCEFFGSPQHSLVYFRMLSPDDERRAPTGRKSSAGAFWQRFRRNSGISSIKYSRREVTAWEVGDVATWLESIQLGEYADSFSSNDVRGRELLALTRTDLKELGVSKVGHVKRLLLAIKEFAA